MKQNEPTQTESEPSKPSTKSTLLSPSVIAERQQVWDRYKNLSKTIWTESQLTNPKTPTGLLQDSQDLHLIMTWIRNHEELNWAEDREHLDLHERVAKLICEEAQIIADLDYYNTKGYGMLISGNNTLPPAEYETVFETGDMFDYYVGPTN